MKIFLPNCPISLVPRKKMRDTPRPKWLKWDCETATKQWNLFSNYFSKTRNTYLMLSTMVFNRNAWPSTSHVLFWIIRALNEFTLPDAEELSKKLSHNVVKLCQREHASRLMLWVKPGRQLSPTQLLGHSATVGWGKESQGQKWENSWAVIMTV